MPSLVVDSFRLSLPSERSHALQREKRMSILGGLSHSTSVSGVSIYRVYCVCAFKTGYMCSGKIGVDVILAVMLSLINYGNITGWYNR